MFAIGESIIAFRGSIGYPATVLQIGEHNGIISYLVHFTGWNHMYDQWFSFNEENVNIYAATPENERKIRSQANLPQLSMTLSGGNATITTLKNVAPERKAGEQYEDPCVQESNVHNAKFSVGEEIVVNYQNNQYVAEIVTIEEYHGRMSYRIHFKCWNSIYDVFVPVGEEHGWLIEDDGPGSSDSSSKIIQMIKKDAH